MPQIAPVTIGSEVYGAPRIIKNGNVLFISPGLEGAVADKKMMIGETAFSSTRPRRTSTIRFEEPKVVVNALGVAEVVDTQVFQGEYSHGELTSSAEAEAFRAKVMSALDTATYATSVVFGRDGQY